MSADGYSFDQANREHVFRYRETVPSWFGMKDRDASNFDRRMVPGIALFAAMGFLVGILFGFGSALILAAASGVSAYRFVKKKLAKEGIRKAVHKLSGPTTQDGVVVDYQVEIRIDQNGSGGLNRERISASPDSAEAYKPVWFPMDGVRSVERRNYSELRVDGYEKFDAGNHWQETAQRMKAERHYEKGNAECVMLVFSTGEELEAGWQSSRNAAAVLQSSLMGFLQHVRQELEAQLTQAARAATIAPDDAPL